MFEQLMCIGYIYSIHMILSIKNKEPHAQSALQRPWGSVLLLLHRLEGKTRNATRDCDEEYCSASPFGNNGFHDLWIHDKPDSHELERCLDSADLWSLDNGLAVSIALHIADPHNEEEDFDEHECHAYQEQPEAHWDMHECEYPAHNPEDFVDHRIEKLSYLFWIVVESITKALSCY